MYGLAVAYCSPGEVAAVTMESMLRFTIEDGAQRQLLDRFISFTSGPRIAHIRNELVAQFMTSSEAEFLLMVDADMAFMGAEPIYRLYDAAREGRKVIGGLCFKVDHDYMVTPTMYDDDHNVVTDWVPGSIVPVASTGCAFLMVHRSVFAAVHALRTVEEPQNPYWWFAETFNEQGELGEDITFCLRAKNAGFQPYVHTGVHIQHRKSMLFGYGAWEARKRMLNPADSLNDVRQAVRKHEGVLGYRPDQKAVVDDLENRGSEGSQETCDCKKLSCAKRHRPIQLAGSAKADGTDG